MKNNAFEELCNLVSTLSNKNEAEEVLLNIGEGLWAKSGDMFSPIEEHSDEPNDEVLFDFETAWSLTLGTSYLEQYDTEIDDKNPAFLLAMKKIQNLTYVRNFTFKKGHTIQ